MKSYLSCIKQVLTFCFILLPSNYRLLNQCDLAQLKRYRRNIALIPHRDKLDIYFSKIMLSFIDSKIRRLTKEV